MILTGDNRSTGRKTIPSAIVYTTNLTWNDLGSNPRFCNVTAMTNNLSQCTAWHSDLQRLNSVSSSVRTPRNEHPACPLTLLSQSVCVTVGGAVEVIENV